MLNPSRPKSLGNEELWEVEMLWTACDVYCKTHGFAMVQPCRAGCSPLQTGLEQDSDAKGLQLGVPRALSHCLEQQREQALTPAAGCGMFVCFLVIQADDLPSSY